MKTSRFTEPQIAMILKQVEDGLGVDNVCSKAGVSQQTYYLSVAQKVWWRHVLEGQAPNAAGHL